MVLVSQFLNHSHLFIFSLTDIKQKKNPLTPEKIKANLDRKRAARDKAEKKKAADKAKKDAKFNAAQKDCMKILCVCSGSKRSNLMFV